MDAMTQKVSDWTLSTPVLADELRDEARGDEYYWNDNGLAELVEQILGGDWNGLHRDFMAYTGVSPTAARALGEELESMAQEPPDWERHIDWEAVRIRLLEV